MPTTSPTLPKHPRDLRSIALRLIYLGLGIGLMAWLFATIDLEATASLLSDFSVLAMLGVLMIYLVESLFDAMAWLLTLLKISRWSQWLWRCFVIRIVGEAFNILTPLAGMGGEPIKVIVLHRRYGIDYEQSAASLVIAKTMNLFALIAFGGCGLWLLLDDQRFSATYQSIAATTLAVLVVAAIVFFSFQYLQLLGTLSTGLASFSWTRSWGDQLQWLGSFNEYLVVFYTKHHWRFAMSQILCFGNWFTGAMATWWTLHFLSYPISLSEALIIESMVQLTRIVAFLIPGGIGVQEGVLVLVCEIITGNPASGLATAVVRRTREAVWIAAGVLIGYKLLFIENTPNTTQTR